MVRRACPPQFLIYLQATEHLLSPRPSNYHCLPHRGVRKLNPLETLHSSNIIQAVHEHKMGMYRPAISEGDSKFRSLPTQTDFSDISVADRGILQGDLNGSQAGKSINASTSIHYQKTLLICSSSAQPSVSFFASRP